jgi:hypothetical protein
LLPPEFSGEEFTAELVAFGADQLRERSTKRGMNRMARIRAAAALATKSLLERRGVGWGAMTRRGLPMVAFTCGSELTGMGAREGCAFTGAFGEALGETGESGTESGSMFGSGWREPERGADGRPVPGCTASTSDSGESGASGGRTYGEDMEPRLGSALLEWA